jgi:Domain of unknown function (DUF4389)
MSEGIKENVTQRSIWLRLVFMIVLSVAFSVAEFVTVAVVAFQFLSSLFTGRPSDRLTHFGGNLAHYLRQIVVYMTFGTEEKPFPFMPWPDEPHEETRVEEHSNQAKDKPENVGDLADNNKEGAAKKRRTTRKTPTTQKTPKIRKTNS